MRWTRLSRTFERALDRLSAAGAEVHEIALAELAEIAGINAPGGLSPIEAYAVHRELFAAHRADYDPRVAARIALGEPVLAADYIRLLQRRADWIARVGQRLAGFDAIVCPTVPIVAPEIGTARRQRRGVLQGQRPPLAQHLRHQLPRRLLFSLPCHEAGELPVGLMLSAPRGHDAALAGVALAVEAALATGTPAGRHG
ncbi:MAG: amidase family protein [Rubrivivax sp.]